MTGNVRRSGPPWSVDLLADLHAGVLDPQTEAELRAAVAHDPEAQDVLAALDATVADLRDLPSIPMPRAVADRIDAALAEEFRRAGASPAQAPAPVVDLAARRRKKQLGWGAGLLAAAAVAVGVVVVTTQGTPASNPGGNVAQPTSNANTPATQRPLAVKGNDFGPVFGDVLKAQNYGPLENQEKLAGCLQGANIASSKPLGVSPITLDDKDAVMAILPGGKPGAFKIVVLDPDTCGPDNPNGVLATSQITP
ncbi:MULTISPECIES: anti-sigma factor family protein [unclassified Saccharothrix]|uniref:anti-sigma factor family protein n=1 Tax=unclassified Saccharothrix TaxID=2593673 RepID=UPI00307E3B99